MEKEPNRGALGMEDVKVQEGSACDTCMNREQYEGSIVGLSILIHYSLKRNGTSNRFIIEIQ